MNGAENDEDFLDLSLMKPKRLVDLVSQGLSTVNPIFVTSTSELVSLIIFHQDNIHYLTIKIYITFI